MESIHITDLEAAINFWRARAPWNNTLALPPEAAHLAKAYGEAIYKGTPWIAPETLEKPALQAWQVWYDTLPDTPCIAICSTSQGDDLCKGCGRSFEEIQLWPSLSPYAKRAVWLRITHEATAWRFTRYAERAVELKHP